MSSSILGVKQRFGIIGVSPALDNALSTAIRVASTELSVLITGESGVGKEVFSKIIHSLSPRKHNKFIAVNCGAIPEGTINSELFGHTKGAFTGATADRKGYFQTVDGGTIFLDEIGEMPLDTQTFLLRVLESGEFIPVGASKMTQTNVRIIAATNVGLLEAVEKGKFREDLYYRLSTVPIKVPSLRERSEDVNLLFRKFVSDFSEKYRTPSIQLDTQSASMLQNYPFPGNIRELKNVAEQLCVLSKNKIITTSELVELYPRIASRNFPSIQKDNKSGDQYERELLYKLLYEMKNDMSELKSIVYNLIKSNDLTVDDINKLKEDTNARDMSKFLPSANRIEAPVHPTHPTTIYEDEYQPTTNPSSQPIIINSPEHHYNTVEEVDQNLSLEEMEIEFINRALKKHRGKRKDASKELGISERTLYRKIKQYNIQE